ncbi:MAG: hypothetical protein GXP42_15115 [Chloroflexi bacterium]|nr:hypothetical protein [Chloroflexota bacterium]
MHSPVTKQIAIAPLSCRLLAPMPNVITRLVHQKRDRSRVNVYIDGEFAFSLPDVEAARLHIGQELSHEELAQLQDLSRESLAFEQCLRLLARRPRSSAEIETYLRGKGYGPHLRERIINRLHSSNYLDDRAFAAWWVENRVQFRPRSRKALRYELRQKGVSADIIDEILADVDDFAQAIAAGRSRALRWRSASQAEFRQKMLGFLQRRGFSHDIADRATSSLWREENAEN